MASVAISEMEIGISGDAICGMMVAFNNLENRLEEIDEGIASSI